MKAFWTRGQGRIVLSHAGGNDLPIPPERGSVSRSNVCCQTASKLSHTFLAGTFRFGGRIAMLLLFLLCVATSAPAQDATNRPAQWARPMMLPGVSNFFQLSTNFYRGAQPTAEGMKQLKALGIKAVINLRNYHSDHSKLADTGLKEVHDEMTPWHATEDEAVEFLKAATATNNLPVFVHCERGADRTGTMCAMYRIVVCGWTKQEAIDEMKNGGFDFSPVWQNLIEFIENADVERIKRRAGLTGA